MMSFIQTPSGLTASLFALLAGSLIGSTTAFFEITGRTWRVGDFTANTLSETTSPKVEVGDVLFNFGSLDVGQKGSHEFQITNRGAGPMTLSRGPTSCTCTISGLDRTSIGVGESATISIQWEARGTGGPFRQQATILTSDPRRPDVIFVIEGMVVADVKADPSTIVMPTLSSSTEVTAESTVFTFSPTPPENFSAELLPSQSSQFFELLTQPLAATELVSQLGATAGFRVVVKARSGLPLGAFRQTIRVSMKIPKDVVIEIPVEGSVVGDLSLAGGLWDSGGRFVLLGTLSSNVGGRTDLFLTAKGPDRDKVHLVVRETIPKSMVVEIGQAAAIGSGTIIRIPISISIPPGSPPCNHLGSKQGVLGRIVLDTGHPSSPSITIPIRVAVQP